MGVQGFAKNIDMQGISAEMAPTVGDWYVDATINVIYPDIAGSNFDRMNNTNTHTTGLAWTGKARIQAVRWPNVATTRQAAVSLREAVFHTAKDPANPFPDFVPQGWRIEVTDCPLDHQFIGGIYVITTVTNSSYDFDVRIEATMDQGSSTIIQDQ